MGQGRRLVLDWQPDDDVLALRAAYRACADPLVQPRLEALWLLRTGLSVRVAAVVVGVEERTVQRWVRWYRDGGRAALCAHPWAGGHGRAPG